MKLKGKKIRKNLLRLFPLKRKKKKDPTYTSSEKDTEAGANAAEAARQKKDPELPWTPEDIFGQIHQAPIPDEMRGNILLIEVGGVDHGWVLDFTGDTNKDDTVVVSRYKIGVFNQSHSKKAPKGPSFTPQDSHLDKSWPWIWYKDRKIFSKIETGKLKDMVAYVTGKIALTGDTSKWDGIESCWNEARERVLDNKRKAQISMGDDVGAGVNTTLYESDEDEDDDEEDDADEEARIMALFAPEVEPTDPRKKEFWMRHFGTDALVSSYLFVLSSIFYTLLCYRNFSIFQLAATFTSKEEYIKYANLMATVFASLFNVIASAYFVKMSYPETMMIMAYRTMTVDPKSMTFAERYFTANEMLTAIWFYVGGGLILPLLSVAVFELIVLDLPNQAFTQLLKMLGCVLGSSIFILSSLPESLRANNGRGSSYVFDSCVIPLLRLEKDTARMAFWTKHLGSDVLFVVWSFAASGVLGGIFVTGLVVASPFSIDAWFKFWAIFPFTIGSFLFVRSSYPETMNSSIFFSSSSVSEEIEGESTPLLSQV